MKQIALFMIRIYQKFISPLKGRSCRFTPTCSVYCYQAIERFGLYKGGLMGLRRIIRCSPYNPGGIDPVPLIEEDSL